MQPLSLHQHTAAAQAADQRRAAAEHRHARRVRRAIGTVALRRATAADDVAVTRLAQLDDTQTPSGELLLAELDGQLVAALPLDGGPAVADPFVRTAEIVELLRVRAAAIAGSSGRGRLQARRIRRAASGLRHAA